LIKGRLLNTAVPNSESWWGAVNLGGISNSFISKTIGFARFSPEQLKKLREINEVRALNNRHVSVTDLPATEK